MAIEIEVATKDCTALTDAELAEMADLSAAEAGGWEVGFLSKQREDWVLVTQVREQSQASGLRARDPRADRRHAEPVDRSRGLHAGAGSGRACSRCRDARPVPPCCSRLPRRGRPRRDQASPTPAGFRAFAGLEDVVPRPEHRATGEERAWGRRLAKRFGADGKLDDRTFVIKGDGDAAGLLDYDPQEPPGECEALAGLFAAVDGRRRDSLVAFGWAMAEALAASTLPLSTHRP